MCYLGRQQAQFSIGLGQESVFEVLTISILNLFNSITVMP